MSAGIWGGNVWLVALMARVAERSGRSWRTRLRMARPVRFWISRETARAVKTMVRWASIASRFLANSGLALRSVLDLSCDVAPDFAVVASPDLRLRVAGCD